MARSRKDVWLRDELVLALDLYLKQHGKTTTADRDALSAELRALPIEQHLTSNPSFRSRASVARKLHNFARLDPDAEIVPSPNGGTPDEEVWAEFAGDVDRLKAAAAAIRANGAALTTAQAEAIEDEIADAPEGRVLTRTHRVRERNPKLIEQRKAKAKVEAGKLACEGCGFDFDAVYGERGEGFIECHHTVPVSTLKPGGRTKVADLALLCSNCHRMVHVRPPWLTMDQLRALVAEHSVTSAPVLESA